MNQVQIVITVDERGQVAVTGPIDNAYLCYGLLGMARDIVFERQQQNKAIVPPSGDDVRRLSLNR